MNAVSVFATVVFVVGWYFFARTDREEVLVRLFFGTLMTLSAGAGFLGLALRLMKV